MKRRDFVRSSIFAAAATVPSARLLYAAVAHGAPVADLTAVTGDGRAISLRGKDIVDLASRLRGRVLLAKDEGYDEARLILNPTFDKHPALIVQPTGAADVQTAVRFARANDLLFAVKCGGHSHSGQSTCDRGMLLDLSSFRGVRADPRARRAWVDGGTLLGQVDHEVMAHGLVTPLGTVSHTGVGGLTLGGGFGRVARKFGLAVDNLASVDLVTADGELRHASADENPDLFWAVRGGGGNFGVVTTFEFRLHPMQREVVAGEIMFPIARVRDVLTLYADYAPKAPDELYVDPLVMLPAAGAPGFAGLHVCYCGAAGEAERALAPIRKLGTPASDGIKRADYVAVQRKFDSTDPRGVGSYIKSGFISAMPGDLVTALVEGFSAHPARTTMLFFQQGGGAIRRVPNDATAFAHRHAMANLLTAVAWRMEAVQPAEHIQWLRGYWSTVERFTHGFYINDTDPEATTEMISANYRENYPRLASIKAKYDPTNLFRLNANVQPKV